ncbi:MAG: hypothetical protein QOJ32_3114 [Frankiaceae bacterium]|jgi:hypothetical protein|nr:hypothetical protein [Frankiaceae bacterium]MDQ1648725.1 hypothetical protein [Frankiaceae bacterium]MDQ1671847.1 hypothetical protein [Frankiaceae bacterium]
MVSSSTDSSKSGSAPFGTDAGRMQEDVELAMARIRELNERAMQAARTAGEAGLDAYEKAMKSFVDVEERLADSTQLDWVKTIIGAQAEFLQNISGSYVNAARDLITK